MNRGIFRKPVVKSSIVPEPTDPMRGDIVQGMVVYTEKRPNVVCKTAIDPTNGKELWVRDPRTNEPIRRQISLVQEGFTERDYIHHDLQNGIVKKHYDFEQSQFDLERKNKPVARTQDLQADVQAMMDRIAELEEQVNSPELPSDQVEVIIEAAIEEEITVVEKPKRGRPKKTSVDN